MKHRKIVTVQLNGKIMVINEIKLGSSYTHTQLEDFVGKNDEYTMNEYGQIYTGRGFIVIENDREDFYSFVSDGWCSNGTTYKCIHIG